MNEKSKFQEFVLKDLVEELREAREEISKYKKLYEKSENELQTQYKVSSVIVHDLRSPVSAIKMANETMMTEGDDLDFDMKLMMMSTIDNEADRVLSLINNLLDMYKMKSGDFDIDKRPVNFSDIIAKSYAALNNLASEKSIEINLRIDSKIDVAGDDRRLQQIMFNILSNSIKFTPPGGNIRVQSVIENRNATISCIDSGVGIPKDEIPLIFQEFKQLSSKSTSGEKGTGLGMAITKKLVEAHDGSIWVESELNKGTTVNIKLPLIDTAQ